MKTKSNVHYNQYSSRINANDKIVAYRLRTRVKKTMNRHHRTHYILTEDRVIYYRYSNVKTKSAVMDDSTCIQCLANLTDY